MPSFTVNFGPTPEPRYKTAKTHVSNVLSVRPVGCDMLQRLAEQHDREATVWTASEVLAAEQVTLILGTPLGHDEFVRRRLELKSREHDLPLFANFTIGVDSFVALCLFQCKLFVEGHPA